MTKEKILVSACLLGVPCRYDGKDNKIDVLEILQQKFHFIPICPEVLGGLPIPRPQAEIVNRKVISHKGEDLSAFFQKGANKSLEIAKKNQVRFALLKAKSPSCGFGLIYDGNFSKTLIFGNGITADLLFQSGIRIFTEMNLDNLFLESSQENRISSEVEK